MLLKMKKTSNRMAQRTNALLNELHMPHFASLLYVTVCWKPWHELFIMSQFIFAAGLNSLHGDNEQKNGTGIFSFVVHYMVRGTHC